MTANLVVNLFRIKVKQAGQEMRQNFMPTV